MKDTERDAILKRLEKLEQRVDELEEFKERAIARVPSLDIHPDIKEKVVPDNGDE